MVAACAKFSANWLHTTHYLLKSGSDSKFVSSKMARLHSDLVNVIVNYLQPQVEYLDFTAQEFDNWAARQQAKLQAELEVRSSLTNVWRDRRARDDDATHVSILTMTVSDAKFSLYFFYRLSTRMHENDYDSLAAFLAKIKGGETSFLYLGHDVYLCWLASQQQFKTNDFRFTLGSRVSTLILPWLEHVVQVVTAKRYLRVV